jgi:dTMP kinase
MRLIVFDGIDGSGKSTQVHLLEQFLLQDRPDLAPNGVIRIAEPTKSQYGVQIQEAMSRNKNRLSFEAELDLFIKDRQENVATNILPSLEEGKVVLLDRYYFSTAAYQGARGRMPYQEILALNEEFAPIPDVVFFFFVPVDVALARIDKDRSRASRSYMERKGNLEKVQAIFEEIYASGRYNSVSIDGTGSIESIASRIQATCKNLLETIQ